MTYGARRDPATVGLVAIACLGGKANARFMFAGSVPYLMLWGYVADGWMMGEAALVAASHTGDAFYDAKLVTAR